MKKQPKTPNNFTHKKNIIESPKKKFMENSSLLDLTFFPRYHFFIEKILCLVYWKGFFFLKTGLCCFFYHKNGTFFFIKIKIPFKLKKKKILSLDKLFKKNSRGRTPPLVGMVSKFINQVSNEFFHNSHNLFFFVDHLLQTNIQNLMERKLQTLVFFDFSQKTFFFINLFRYCSFKILENFCRLKDQETFDLLLITREGNESELKNLKVFCSYEIQRCFYCFIQFFFLKSQKVKKFFLKAFLDNIFGQNLLFFWKKFSNEIVFDFFLLFVIFFQNLEKKLSFSHSLGLLFFNDMLMSWPVKFTFYSKRKFLVFFFLYKVLKRRVFERNIIPFLKL